MTAIGSIFDENTGEFRLIQEETTVDLILDSGEFFPLNNVHGAVLKKIIN